MGRINNKSNGNFISLSDSSDDKIVSFAMYGKAKQESTTGAQLFDYENNLKTVDGLSIVVNNDKSLSIKGTTTKAYVAICSYDVDLEAGDYCVSGGKNANGCIYTQVQKILSDGSTKNYSNGYFSVDGTETVIRFMLQTGNYYGEIDYTIYPMINKDNVVLPFEPYTGGIASPNPDYPQEIEVAGASGSVEVKSVGKNLLKNTTTTKTVNGITFTVNEDGSVSVKGTNTNTSGGTVFDIPLSLINGVTYIANGIFGGSYADGCTVHFQNKLGSVTLAGHISNGEKKFTKNDSDCDVGIYRIRVAPSATVDTIIYPMIRLASDTDGTYQPYKESVITIPTPNGLPGIPVSSNGNYTDENGQQWVCDEIIKYADGTGKYVQRTKTYSLAVSDMNNSENYPGWRNVEGLSDVAGSNFNGWVDSMSTIYKRCGVNTTYEQSTIFFDKGWDGFALTQTEIKTKHPDLVVDILVLRKTPIITDLSAEEIAEIEKLQTFYPVTNISNDADCYMEIVYKSIFHEWLFPKTDWKSTDRFNISDYNRIKSNLYHLHELATSLWKSFYIEDMGEDITEYTAYWDVDIFNYFENNLESINQNILTQDFGASQKFYENAPFIKWDELNRIESSILSMYDLLQRQKLSLRNISFKLGSFKEVKI